MNSEFAKDLMYESAAIAATEMLNLTSLAVDQNKIVGYIKMGLLWTSLSEVTNMIRYQQSNVNLGNYTLLVDNAFFNSVTWGVLQELKIGEKVYDLGDDLFAVVPPNIREAVVSGVIKVSAKELQKYIRANYSDGFLGYITNITKLMR